MVELCSEVHREIFFCTVKSPGFEFSFGIVETVLFKMKVDQGTPIWAVSQGLWFRVLQRARFFGESQTP